MTLEIRRTTVATAVSLLLLTTVDAFSTQNCASNQLTQLAYSTQDQILVEKDVAIEALQQEQHAVTGGSLSSPEDEQNQQNRKNSISLIQLATDPLLCMSSRPILSEAECRTLMDWCHKAENGSLATPLMEESTDENGAPASEGAKILWKVQNYVHHDLLGIDDGEYVVPRYLFYSSRDGKDLSSIEGKVDPRALLPDGLHVDTNGSQHFRHWTVLVYLTSNRDSGATIFPLASRYPPVAKNNGGTCMLMERAKTAAKNMLYRLNKHHTRSFHSGQTIDEAVVIEEVAAQLWEQNHSKDKVASPGGIRVIPKLGHVCVFSGVNPDGYPNPLSFHGGETLLRGDGDKALLSFFYEVPSYTFSSRQEFGERVTEREKHFMVQQFGSSSASRQSQDI